jgi:anti-sigma regulatory factor (Ser/Thr protein kinase)
MSTDVAPAAFAHEALVYHGLEDLLAHAVPFIRAGLAAGEPVMVAMTADKLDALRARLGTDADAVKLLDMAQVGRNPAWIIPAWQRFVDEHAPSGRPLRGIGEPIWAQRTPDELVECQLHEALLNLAFAGRVGFRLLCPYDAATLGAEVLHEARCSHPWIVEDGVVAPSVELRAADHPRGTDAPLPPPPVGFDALAIERRTLREARALVARRAAEAGLPGRRVHDTVRGVHELATNSVRHGGGNGVLRVWSTDGALVCEVRDPGHIADPLAGRRRPAPDARTGRGLWTATQLSDLLQIRSRPGESVVRLVMRRADIP